MSPATQNSSLGSTGKPYQGKDQGTLELQSIKFVTGAKGHSSPAQPVFENGNRIKAVCGAETFSV